MNTRRAFLRDSALLGAAAAITATPAIAGQPTDGSSAAEEMAPLAPLSGTLSDVARDEAYWTRVAAQYRVTHRTTNMEAGFWGMMSNPSWRRTIGTSTG